MLERVGLFPSSPVTRARMLDVGSPVSFRKLAMLLSGTLKSPKLWNRLVPPPGLVPPVMSYCTVPAGGVAERLTSVFSPEGVMGRACAWLLLGVTDKNGMKRAKMETITGRET